MIGLQDLAALVDASGPFDVVQFATEFYLIIENCFYFNAMTEPVYQQAVGLLSKFLDLTEEEEEEVRNLVHCVAD